MEKIDHKKLNAQFYKSSAKTVSLVDVPAFNFLMIDGQGDPNHSEEYAQAIAALYSLAYTLKFMIKKGGLAIDYAVMPLEGLWWADDLSAFIANDKSQWKWTMMIMQPEYITQSLFEIALADVSKKKKLPSLSQVRFESYKEGLCAQTLHVGPFSEEGPTVAKVHVFIESQGVLRGKHHEIYLSDIRKAAPQNWKTIVRQPLALR